MVMILHQTVDMDNGSVSFMGRLQIGKEFLPIPVCFKNGSSFISPRCDVIEGARIL